LDHPLDRRFRSFELRLHVAVAAVAHPARHAGVVSPLTAGLAEPDALHSARHHHSTAHHRRNGTISHASRGDHVTNDEDRAEARKGKAKEVAGYATGDREVEAEGKLDQLDAAGASAAEDDDEAAAEAVEQATNDTRREHGELH